VAEKYLISGATYNGDGTSSAAASSNGGVGAWNDLAYFTAGTTPAYGSLSAGDIVYIRSKTSAGADITVNFNSASLTIGSANASATAPISWVIDGGTKWSGIDGTFTFSQTTNTGNYGVTLRQYNWLKCENQDKLVFSQVGASIDKIGTLLSLAGGCIVENTLFDTSTNAVGLYGAVPIGMSGGYNGNAVKWRNCNFKIGSFYSNVYSLASGYTLTQFVNCNFELTRAKATEADALFKVGSAGSKFQFIGGRIFGAGAASAHNLVNTYDSIVEFIGTQIPSFEAVELFATSNGIYINDIVRSFGADGKMGSEAWATWGLISSRADNFPPTLNAVLPDSANTPWSYLVYPKGITSQYTLNSGNYPTLPISKAYTSAAAQKKITLEFLLSTTVANANKKTVWMDVVYIDNSDGLPRCLTTQIFTGTDALDTSSANWSATTWGAKLFNKNKLEVTTPGSIKQDTMVHVLLHWGVAAPNPSDVGFVCPDLQLSTP
jgi:hypothetical protein